MMLEHYRIMHGRWIDARQLLVFKASSPLMYDFCNVAVAAAFEEASAPASIIN
jgi:hypothetical protein